MAMMLYTSCYSPFSTLRVTFLEAYKDLRDFLENVMPKLSTTKRMQECGLYCTFIVIWKIFLSSNVAIAFKIISTSIKSVPDYCDLLNVSIFKLDTCDN